MSKIRHEAVLITVFNALNLAVVFRRFMLMAFSVTNCKANLYHSAR